MLIDNFPNQFNSEVTKLIPFSENFRKMSKKHKKIQNLSIKVKKSYICSPFKKKNSKRINTSAVLKELTLTCRVFDKKFA